MSGPTAPTGPSNWNPLETGCSATVSGAVRATFPCTVAAFHRAGATETTFLLEISSGAGAGDVTAVLPFYAALADANVSTTSYASADGTMAAMSGGIVAGGTTFEAHRRPPSTDERGSAILHIASCGRSAGEMLAVHGTLDAVLVSTLDATQVALTATF